MTAWWESLPEITRMFYIIAIPSSVIIILQTVLSLFGFDSDHDFDMGGDDFDISADISDLRIFSFRGIMAFITVFSWTGVLTTSRGMNIILAVVISVLAGLATMFIVAKLFQMALKLQSEGNINFKNALGQTAEVYIPIPANQKGTGKVMLTVQERYIEASAVTEGGASLKTGTLVRVVDVKGDVLVVEKTSD